MNNLYKSLAIIGTGAVVASGVYLSNQSDNTPSNTRDTDYSTTRSFKETGDKDCGDFRTQSEAQRFFIAEGGPDEDFHGLDRDSDGVVCETLP